MWAVFKRDFFTYVNSAMAWIVTAAYLLVTGLIYSGSLKNFADRCMTAGMDPMRAGGAPNVMQELITPYIWWMGFLMMFFLPMLTMRLFAEERRTGTLELLFTYPLTDADIVLGKFFSAMAVVCAMLSFSLVSIFTLSQKVQLEWNLVASGYAGLLLMAGAFVSLGIWASSLTSSQVVAAVVPYCGLMMTWLVQLLDEIPLVATAKEKLGGLSLLEHLEAMVRGNITSHDLVFFLAWIALFLYLSCRVLESRKWSS